MKRDLYLIAEAYKSVYEQANDFTRWVDFYFEDLYTVTDPTELASKIRERIETPEIVEKYGNAATGNLVEIVQKAIMDEQKRRSALQSSTTGLSDNITQAATTNLNNIA